MSQFIMLHKNGVSVLVNLDHVEEIRESEDKDGSCTVYYAYSCPNENFQDYLNPDESFKAVVEQVWG